MDLMIEAKDKEQAVYKLMRTFKLPGFDTFNDVLPHVRNDESRPSKPVEKKTPRKKKDEELRGSSLLQMRKIIGQSGKNNGFEGFLDRASSTRNRRLVRRP
jgi:hypothetical protein